VGKCPDTGYYLSEDYYFCKLARECGYDVYLDEGVLVEHSGKMLYPTNDESLVRGASTLLHTYNDNAPMSETFTEAIRQLDEVTDKFMEKRGLK
jgi:hypothetical protein